MLENLIVDPEFEEKKPSEVLIVDNANVETEKLFYI